MAAAGQGSGWCLTRSADLDAMRRMSAPTERSHARMRGRSHASGATSRAESARRVRTVVSPERCRRGRSQAPIARTALTVDKAVDGVLARPRSTNARVWAGAKIGRGRFLGWVR